MEVWVLSRYRAGVEECFILSFCLVLIDPCHPASWALMALDVTRLSSLEIFTTPILHDRLSAIGKAGTQTRGQAFGWGVRKGASTGRKAVGFLFFWLKEPQRRLFSPNPQQPSLQTGPWP